VADEPQSSGIDRRRLERFGWDDEQGLSFSDPHGDYQRAHDQADVAADILGGLGVTPEQLDEKEKGS
jgi:hypothetical protein